MKRKKLSTMLVLTIVMTESLIGTIHAEEKPVQPSSQMEKLANETQTDTYESEKSANTIVEETEFTAADERKPENGPPESDQNEPENSLPESDKSESESGNPETDMSGSGSEESETDMSESESEHPETDMSESESEHPETDISESESDEPVTDKSESESGHPETDMSEPESQNPENDMGESESDELKTDLSESESENSEADEKESETADSETERKESETGESDRIEFAPIFSETEETDSAEHNKNSEERFESEVDLSMFINVKEYPEVNTSKAVKEIYQFLREKSGLNHAAACGVLANIHLESNFDPTAVGDGGTSLGLCQWHLERCRSLMNYCQTKGLDYCTIEGQMEYLQYELETFYLPVLKHLLEVEDSAQGAYDAAEFWCLKFEMPSCAAMRAMQRGNLAQTEYYPETFKYRSEEICVQDSAELEFYR